MSEASQVLLGLLTALTNGTARALTIVWDGGAPDRPSSIEIKSNGPLPSVRLLGVRNGLESVLSALGLTRADYTERRNVSYRASTFCVVRQGDTFHVEQIV